MVMEENNIENRIEIYVNNVKTFKTIYQPFVPFIIHSLWEEIRIHYNFKNLLSSHIPLMYNIFTEKHIEIYWGDM